MFLTILIVTAVFLVLFLLQRYQTKMAALIAWIIGSIIKQAPTEEKSSKLIKQPRKTKNVLKKADSKDSRETSPQESRISPTKHASNKITEIELKSKKNKSNKESIHKQNLGLDEAESKNFDTDTILLKLKAATEKTTVTTTEWIQVKQERSKRKKVSKSADKLLQNAEDCNEKTIITQTSKCENKLQSLNIKKSESLPNFQRTIETKENTKVSKKEANNNKLQKLLTNPEVKVNREPGKQVEKSESLPNFPKTIETGENTKVSKKEDNNKKVQKLLTNPEVQVNREPDKVEKSESLPNFQRTTETKENSKVSRKKDNNKKLSTNPEIKVTREPNKEVEKKTYYTEHTLGYKKEPKQHQSSHNIQEGKKINPDVHIVEKSHLSHCSEELIEKKLTISDTDWIVSESNKTKQSIDKILPIPTTIKKDFEPGVGNIVPETKLNFPPSEIIDHYKSKYRSDIPLNVKGVLLESSVHTSAIPKSKTSVEVLQAPPLKEVIETPPLEEVKLSTESTTANVSLTSDIMKITTQVRIVTLNDNEHLESILYRIEKKWILQFRLGSSLLGRKVALYCNYPEQRNGNLTEFNRNKYYLLPWSQDEGCCNSDDTALFAQLTVHIAGSFHYYFIYENATESGPQGSGYFLVDPVLQYGKEEELPLNCIKCQTVMSKCLGPFSTWENKLLVSKESGYNLIHFTPIQELGKSNSGYSLSGQLKLNSKFNENDKKVTFEDLEKLLSKIRKEWKVLSICDIVLNHTANETDWLQEHPEGTYNCFTCPYMRPAYFLDAALAKFSEDVKGGFYETMGIPAEVSSEDHLNSIRYSLQTKVLKEANIPEMYMCDVNKLVSQFLELARKNAPTAEIREPVQKLKLIQDPSYHRLASVVDMNLALTLYNTYRQGSFDEEARIKRCSEDFKNQLDALNNNIISEINKHIGAAIENVIAGIRYFRVQQDGPKIREITVKDPLCSRYFTDFGEPKTMVEYETIMYSENSKYLMAHNGWVMNSDPMRNFADSDSNVYIRRELIAWGDSVKLRFGNKPEDCPFLWEHMRAYVELTARIFDGVRLDNCHSTPLPVAEYLLDCARKVRPDLYVVAELFTNSDHTDNVFVNRLGITSLIREGMSAWDSHEEGRLVHRYGGDPVGAFFQPHSRPLVPSIAHALFLDLSHDNPSPIQKRSVFDLLPSAALVNMACCASGSNRGYDELVNHHIHVVDEDRQYTEWTNDITLAIDNPRYVSSTSGIIYAKKCINDLHFKLGQEGFSQVYVDQIDPDIVAVTRHRPQTHESVILVAFTAFSHPSVNAGNYQRLIKPLCVEGVLEEIILEATLSHISCGKGGSKYANSENFKLDSKYINGLSEYRVDVKQHIQLGSSDTFELANSSDPNVTQLNFKNFKPGSVAAIRVSLQKSAQESISKLRETMSTLSRKNNTDLSNIVCKLSLSDLNRALYRCDQEERDEGLGFSTYNIPNFGSLVYCGLQGFISLLSTIRSSNDLGHPMCGNLRDGNWMIDYICQRLKLDDGTKQLGQWIDKNTQPLKNIPRYLVPGYFEMMITNLYMLLLERSYQLMSDFVKNGSTFVKGLSLGSLQFGAVIKSADLPTLSPNLSAPKPQTKLNNQGNLVQACVTLSAGLPHFSVGYMRNWGRDTFIALRGLFILTGRFEDARYHILGYAACLRHGLIPNLLDAGKNSRFNCRDAVWWWLYCIKSYVDEVPDGIKILSDKVSRIFPTDDSPALAPGVVDQPLYEVIQESLKTHFQGLSFRERNAGRQIDAHMNDRGFNNQIGIHPETGFVFGGNEFNCGTWMDKMGSSDMAGNRGKPATPRDGSAVELIGLSKAVVTWLGQLHKSSQYPYEGVERINKNGSLIKWSFNEWSEKIQINFEKYFWIDTSPVPTEIRPDLINKRGIYKDSCGATQDWADFQLRCNFPIAMVAAPELFNPKHAWIALQNAEKHLLGPLGMKTLDPDDWVYCGDYNNADDSDNHKTAHGFNYHQGPEWVWPLGYYLRARLHFAAENGELPRAIANVKVILSKHFTELQTSLWRGLPELTNSNGAYCNDSSRTQAWSMSCTLEVLRDLQQIELRKNQLRSN